MDEETLRRITELEANSRFPTGMGNIYRKQCKRGATSPMACMLCPVGHMLECHYPHTCGDARCSHLKSEESMGSEIS